MPEPAVKRTVFPLSLGLCAGLLSGLFGIGGGTVLVPGLVLLGLSQHHAHATSLAAIILTAGAALVPFARDGSVAFAPGATIAAGALLGAYLGAGLMRLVSARRLRQAFAVVALAVAVQLIAGGDPQSGGVVAPLDVPRLTGLAGLGLATGVLSALMGVGGGL
ncbi:MAG: sulfite exporter TauE/SafE family protein, partial [Actinomycetota bacterium]|nr:sulfite exporter TauE/SafE family protein [Actinomycetota bacterium]